MAACGHQPQRQRAGTGHTHVSGHCRSKDCFETLGAPCLKSYSFIAKVSLVGGALAWGLDPRCSGRRLFLYRGFKFVLLFWSTVIAQRFGIANMKSIGMGLGTWDRTSNRTFSISVFHHRTNRPIRDRQKAIFFCGRRKDIFFRRKDPFFRRKDFFFCGRTGSISVGVRFGVPTEPREASSVRCSYRTTVPKRYRKASLGFRKRKIVFQPCFTTRNLRTKLCGIRSQPEERKGLLVKP